MGRCAAQGERDRWLFSASRWAALITPMPLCCQGGYHWLTVGVVASQINYDDYVDVIIKSGVKIVAQ